MANRYCDWRRSFERRAEPLVYAMQWILNGDAQTPLYGDFIVVGSAFGSDGAPRNRPPSYGTAPASARPSGASLSFGDQIVSVTLAGAELLAPLVARTGSASTVAQLARDQALTLAGAAANSASFAEEFSGPAYDPLAAGQTATASGKFFRVSDGDTPRTYTRYQRTASGSVVAAQLATTPALASSDGAKLTSYRRTATTSLRTLESKLFELDLSITDFQTGGAVGVGNAVADTAAIIAAHNALPAAGGTIFLPDGTYYWGNVVLTKRVVLYGNGCSSVADSLGRCQIYKMAGTLGPVSSVQGLGSQISGIEFEEQAGNVGDRIEIVGGAFVRMIFPHIE